MFRKDKEVTNRAWIDDVLKRADYLELGLCGNDMQPYVVPVNFGYDGENFYLHGAVRGLKLDLIRQNPRVCFQVAIDTEVVRKEQPVEFSMKYRSVTGFGEAQILEDAGEKRAGLVCLMKHFDGPTEPLPDAVIAKTAVIRVRISEISGKVSQYPNPDKL